MTVADSVRLVAELSAIGIGEGAARLVVVAQGAEEHAAIIKLTTVTELLAAMPVPSVTPTEAVP